MDQRINPKNKIRSSVRKIFRITLLLALREIYLYLRNLYGLACHPFLTIKRIKKEKDLSQGLLIFGLPGYFWAGAIFFLALLRFFIGIHGRLGWVAYSSLFSVTSVSGLIMVYLFYWLYLTFKERNGGSR